MYETLVNPQLKSLREILPSSVSSLKKHAEALALRTKELRDLSLDIPALSLNKTLTALSGDARRAAEALASIELKINESSDSASKSIADAGPVISQKLQETSNSINEALKLLGREILKSSEGSNFFIQELEGFVYTV